MATKLTDMSFQDFASKLKIKLGLIDDLAFFGAISYRLPIVEGKNFPVAATDGKCIYINPEVIGNYSLAGWLGILLHEIQHVSLFHMTRRGNKNPFLWNIAGDYVINLFIKDLESKDRIELPKDALLDEKYRGMSTEQVYDKLLEDVPPQLKDIIENPGKYTPEEIKDKLGPLANDCIYSEAEDKDGNTSKMEDEIRTMLVEAKTSTELSGKKAGKMPSELERYLDKLYKPALPWKSILQNYLTEITREGFNFLRPNRRYMTHKVYLPERKSVNLAKVDLVIDTSGSINNELFLRFMSEVNHLLSKFRPKEIALSQFDHKHRGTDILTPHSDLKKVEFKGGGGTCIKETLEVLNKTSTSKVIIILTDGCIFDLDECSHLLAKLAPRLVWCVYDNEEFTSPGKVIKVDLDSLRARD